MIAPMAGPTAERTGASLGRDAAIFHFNFTNPAARTRIVDENLPNLRLRIAVHAGNGDNMIHVIAL